MYQSGQSAFVILGGLLQLQGLEADVTSQPASDFTFHEGDVITNT